MKDLLTSMAEELNDGSNDGDSYKPQVTSFDSFVEDDNGDTIKGTITMTFERIPCEEHQVREFIFIKWSGEREPFMSEAKFNADVKENIHDWFASRGLSVKFN